ncbi:MAG: AbrB/MazE/SpoVT family DNA-binding domain-containing protein [Nanoarchaeota archaeon]
MNKKMEIIKTSSRGQIVIPEEIRKRHDIKKGTRLVLFELHDKIIIEKEEKINSFLKQNLDAEEKGWGSLAETSLKEVWGNEKDDKIWKKYL